MPMTTSTSTSSSTPLSTLDQSLNWHTSTTRRRPVESSWLTNTGAINRTSMMQQDSEAQREREQVNDEQAHAEAPTVSGADISGGVMTQSCVRVILIRHAESAMNTAPHLIGGQSNAAPLTSNGERQSSRLGARLKIDQLRFDAVYTSTAVRAVETARLMMENAGMKGAIMQHQDNTGDVSESVSSSSPSPSPPSSDANVIPIIRTPLLLEQSQGSWEGQPRKAVYTDEVKKQMLDLHIDFRSSDGESLRMAGERAANFLQPEIDKWRKMSEEQNRMTCIGVVSHGGCIRSLLHHWVGLDPRYTWLVSVDNTSMSELRIDRRGIALVGVNDHAHLLYELNPPHTHVHREACRMK